jgi:glycerophosphoryl diester phosphodiesterase
VVIHHDAEIAGVGPVHALRAGELPSWVPGLDEALDSCAGAAVNVEVKNAPIEPGYDPHEAVAAEVAAALAASARRPRSAPAHVIVSSFWPASLEAVRATDPDVAMGLLVHPALDAVEAAGRAAALGCTALHPFHSRVNAALVDLVHEMGMSVMTWTVNEPDEVTAAAGAGVDGIISDRVTTTLAALGRR